VSKKTKILVALIIVLVSVFLWVHQEDFDAGPKNIILYIGDGMGAAQRRVPEEVYGKRLSMNTLPALGLFTTHCAVNRITDSAAAGTAMSTGHKTRTGSIATWVTQEAVIPFHSSPDRDPIRHNTLGIDHMMRLTVSAGRSTAAPDRGPERTPIALDRLTTCAS